jgi:hypothetical protein
VAEVWYLLASPGWLDTHSHACLNFFYKKNILVYGWIFVAYPYARTKEKNVSYIETFGKKISGNQLGYVMLTTTQDYCRRM